VIELGGLWGLSLQSIPRKYAVLKWEIKNLYGSPDSKLEFTA
jgi:hypothetical protein